MGRTNGREVQSSGEEHPFGASLTDPFLHGGKSGKLWLNRQRIPQSQQGELVGKPHRIRDEVVQRRGCRPAALHEGADQCVQDRRLTRYRAGIWLGQHLIQIRQFAIEPQKPEKLGCRSFADATCCNRMQEFVRRPRNHIGYELPRTWRRESPRIAGRVKLGKQGGTVAQERPDFRRDPVGYGPSLPIFARNLQIEMNEPIKQRRNETMGTGSVFAAIARGHDAPAFGQLVLANSAIESQLQARGLNERCRLSQLIEKQNSVTSTWQECRRTPDGLVAIQSRQPSQVDGIEQGGPDIDEVQAQRLSGLPDNTRFADARRSPQIDRPPGRNERCQALRNF